MGDSPPLSPDSMTEEQFLQFISRAPAAYKAAASQYWVARRTGQTPPGWGLQPVPPDSALLPLAGLRSAPLPSVQLRSVPFPRAALPLEVLRAS